MENLDKIIGYFEPGKTPTYEEFKKSWTSFFHKSEKFPQTQVIGLNDALDNKATKEDVANATTNFKGYHTTLAALLSAYPQAQNRKDFFAWVGSPYPGTVWKVDANGGVWADTGEVPTQEEIDLSEYAKTEDVNDLFSQNSTYNLLNIENVQESKSISATGIIQNATITSNITPYIDISVGKVYNFIGERGSNKNAFWYKLDGTFISSNSVANGSDFIPPVNASKLLFYLSNDRNYDGAMFVEKEYANSQYIPYGLPKNTEAFALKEELPNLEVFQEKLKNILYADSFISGNNDETYREVLIDRADFEIFCLSFVLSFAQQSAPPQSETDAAIRISFVDGNPANVDKNVILIKKYLTPPNVVNRKNDGWVVTLNDKEYYAANQPTRIDIIFDKLNVYIFCDSKFALFDILEIETLSKNIKFSTNAKRRIDLKNISLTERRGINDVDVFTNFQSEMVQTSDLYLRGRKQTTQLFRTFDFTDTESVYDIVVDESIRYLPITFDKSGTVEVEFYPVEDYNATTGIQYITSIERIGAYGFPEGLRFDCFLNAVENTEGICMPTYNSSIVCQFGNITRELKLPLQDNYVGKDLFSIRLRYPITVLDEDKSSANFGNVISKTDTPSDLVGCYLSVSDTELGLYKSNGSVIKRYTLSAYSDTSDLILEMYNDTQEGALSDFIIIPKDHYDTLPSNIEKIKKMILTKEMDNYNYSREKVEVGTFQDSFESLVRSSCVGHKHKLRVSWKVKQNKIAEIRLSMNGLEVSSILTEDRQIPFSTYNGYITIGDSYWKGNALKAEISKVTAFNYFNPDYKLTGIMTHEIFMGDENAHSYIDRKPTEAGQIVDSRVDSVSLARLERSLSFFKAQGYKVISFSELEKIASGRMALESDAIIYIADDWQTKWFKDTPRLNIMKKYGAALNCALNGDPNHWAKDQYGNMSQEDFNSLKSVGWGLGYHGYKHGLGNEYLSYAQLILHIKTSIEAFRSGGVESCTWVYAHNTHSRMVDRIMFQEGVSVLFSGNQEYGRVQGVSSGRVVLDRVNFSDGRYGNGWDKRFELFPSRS